MTTRPVDHEARERARVEHGTSFVLQAGAGTGKTTLLVDRIEALVRSGRARLTEVAAVTFTENAAATLKLRLRERLEQARADAAAPAAERQRAEAALAVLERAQVSTIHALCAALLQERPLESGVVPGFRVADDAEQDALFAEAWDEWLAGALTTGDEVLGAALDEGIPLVGEGRWGERSSLRGLARTLVEQRDLEPLLGREDVSPPAWRDELAAQGARARALAATARDGDILAARLLELAAQAEAARALEGRALVKHLRALKPIPRNLGRADRWPGASALEEARGIAEWTKDAFTAWRAALGSALHARLVRALLGVVRLYEERKRARGALDWLDLLLLARNALRDHPLVRAHLRRRFPYLIIDEFQDTDPLQVEVARLLGGDAPGALVLVGDAKQSIYRFRRAEVSLFRRMADEARARPGAAVLELTQNFRSRPALLRFVNRVFGALLQQNDASGQPAYEAIHPRPGLSDEPSVLGLRFEAPLAEKEDLLRAESRALAALLAEVAAGGYEVRDAGGANRSSRAGDVMVLTRRLTQVRHLEEALEAAGLRYVVEGGKSFFDRQEVGEVLSVLRAIDDPSDRLSLVAALRSGFFGVSDRDLVAYALGGGALWMGAVDETLPGAAAVGPALGLLQDLHRRRTRESVAAILERLYDETRVLATLAGTGRRGDAPIANLQKVVGLARLAGDVGVLTLRGFATLLQQRIEDAREEPDLPSTRPGDPGTIRILSIHKAKGLEAPVVALFDTDDELRGGGDVIPLWDEQRVAVGFRRGCQPPGWDALKQAEDLKAAAEGRRLLYVACTRARDWLVVPCPPRDARTGTFWRDITSALPPADDADVRYVTPGAPPEPVADVERLSLRELAGAKARDAAGERWDQERAELLLVAAERLPLPISVTAAAARLAPPAVVAGSPGGGRAFGSLVHRVLEWLPLDAGAPAAAAMAAALAPAFGLDEDAARHAGEAVARALSLPLMDRARRATRVWREMPLWFPDGADLIEGVIDLVFEEDGGLVVVDYKTDHVAAEQALAQAAHHAPQLQLYGRGLAQATGQPVRERLVLFTTPGLAVPV